MSTRRRPIQNSQPKSPAGEPGSLPSFTPPFARAFALVFLLLLFRRPDTLFNAQFWAEDITVFFKDQLLIGLPYTLFLPSAGYLHFVPRLVAAFASWFPVVHGPLIYNLWATTLAAAALSLFALPGYRFLIAPDSLRIAACAVAAAVFPAPEVLGTVTNLQWYLAVGAMALLFYPVPEEWAGSRRFQLLSGSGGLILACTSPQLLLFLPFVVWRLVRSSGVRRTGPLLALAGMAIQISALAAHGTAPAARAATSLAQLVSVTLVAPAYRCLLANVVGDQTSMALTAQSSTLTNAGSFLLFALWLLWLFRNCSGPARWSVAVTAYAIFASIAIAAARRPWGVGFDVRSPWIEWGGGRYALLGSVLIVYLAALTVERLAGRRARWVSVACLLALFANGLRSNYLAPAFRDLDWTAQARQIEAWTAQPATPRGLQIPVNPSQPWNLYLPARLNAATPESPWEGCLVRGQLLFAGTTAVYYIQNNRKLHVLPAWVTAQGLRWDEDVRPVPLDALQALPDSP